MRPIYGLIILLAVFAPTLEVAAQTDSLSTAKGNVTFVADSSIIALEKGSRKFRETKGYRIQLFLGPLEQVKAERNKYLALGLPYSAYMKQIVPEHALQVGDFTSKMQMEKCLQEVRDYYPDAFGVIEIIEPPKYGRKPKSSR